MEITTLRTIMEITTSLSRKTAEDIFIFPKKCFHDMTENIWFCNVRDLRKLHV